MTVQPAGLPKPALMHAAPPHATRPAAVIYASNEQNDAQLREWKNRKAASMNILEKTTNQMPLS
jgi:hypothetical protein